MDGNGNDKPAEKLKVGMYWAASCGGCDISLLEIGPHILDLIQIADVVFWPVAADFKYEHVVGYPDGNPVIMESGDGTKWEKGPELELDLLGDPPEHCVLNPNVICCPQGGFDGKSVVFKDCRENDPDRRYKVLLFPFTDTRTNVGGIEGGPGMLACSGDGIRWAIDPKH